MDKYERYREKNRHPCLECGVGVLRTSVRCVTCSRALKSRQLADKPLRLKHGYVGRPEYHVWCSMVQRCTNSNANQYADYGGRGIRVCRRWRVFENFIADMGPRPPSSGSSRAGVYSVGRADNRKGYSPSNCRWETNAEQCVNRRNNRLVTFRGETHPATVWIRSLGLSYKKTYQRLERGWSPERAFGG